MYPQYIATTDIMSFYLQSSYLSIESKIEDEELNGHTNKVVMWVLNLPILFQMMANKLSMHSTISKE